LADERTSTKENPIEKGHNWQVITFADASLSSGDKGPGFSVRPDDDNKGWLLEIDFGDPAFDKANMISARLHREDGEIVESVGGNLNAPRPADVTGPDDFNRPPSEWHAQTSFPWGKNTLDESWIEVSMGQERYWLEIPYGFDRNPKDALPPTIPGKRPHFAAPMKKTTTHDHIVQWDEVSYEILPVQGGYSISLGLCNPGDAIGKLFLYQEKGGWDLHTPRTFLKAIDSDGTEIESRCTGIRLDEDTPYGRDDTFSFNRYPFYDRCWGQIEIRVGTKSYRIVVPSSMYEFGQGHPTRP
jgi:hypothetical protein